MPTAAAKVCTYPGCGTLVLGGSRCKAHDHRTLHDKERGTPAERGYSTAWRKARAEFMVDRAIAQGWPYPCCECDECKRENRRVRAVVVDHIVPHKGDQKLFWDRANWQVMSKQCHDRKTATEDGGFGFQRRDGHE